MILGFILGVVATAVVSFFIIKNNKAKFLEELNKYVK